MADEVGPYKVVANLVSPKDRFRYSIVCQNQYKSSFFQEVIPDAGDSQTARKVCNLLNKNHREEEDRNAKEVGDDEGVSGDGADPAGS